MFLHLSVCLFTGWGEEGDYVLVIPRVPLPPPDRTGVPVPNPALPQNRPRVPLPTPDRTGVPLPNPAFPQNRPRVPLPTPDRTGVPLSHPALPQNRTRIALPTPDRTGVLLSHPAFPPKHNPRGHKRVKMISMRESDFGLIFFPVGVNFK